MAPFIYHTNIIFIWLKITPTNITLKSYLMARNLRQRILHWKLTETAPSINQYYEYYSYLYHTKIPFIWLGITSTNITLKIKPKRPHLWHTKITFVWLGITLTWDYYTETGHSPATSIIDSFHRCGRLSACREPAGKLWQLCKVLYVYLT